MLYPGPHGVLAVDCVFIKRYLRVLERNHMYICNIS